MAGHRRSRGTPRAVTIRSQRRRDAFAHNLAAADTPADQVGAAAGYAIGLLVWLQQRADTADAADRMVRAISTVADDLVATAERNAR